MDDLQYQNILSRELDGAWCSILKIGQTTLLLDCGCDEFAPEVAINKISPLLSHVDAILLSHASISSLGCLPYLFSQNLLQNVLVYSTSPVAKLGA